MFTIYINNLPKVYNILKLDDDTNNFCSDKDKVQSVSINTEFTKIGDWLHCNQQSLNLTYFHAKKSQTYTIILMCNCWWKTFIEKPYAVHIQKIEQIHKYIDNSTKESKHTLHHSLVNPYLQYCNVGLGSTSTSIIQPLLVKQTVRMIADAKHNDYTDELYKGLSILKLPDIHHIEVLKCLINYQVILIPCPLHVHLQCITWTFEIENI